MIKSKAELLKDIERLQAQKEALSSRLTKLKILSKKNTKLSLKQQVGLNIRHNRKEAKLTESELGNLIGLTRATIANMEAARQGCSIENLYAIAKALDIPVTQLLP